MFLPGVLLERARTHAISQRPCCINGAASVRNGLKQAHSTLVISLAHLVAWAGRPARVTAGFRSSESPSMRLHGEQITNMLQCRRPLYAVFLLHPVKGN